MSFKHGDRVTVQFSGIVHMTWTVSRDGQPHPAIELFTDAGEKMIVPAVYATEELVTEEAHK